ncbi:hypothetical protein DW322_02740 [Rhodococcus rhodnii]|uniref:Lipoprotein n=2 Tax=Rhodococcus rhodnii TaxID=38312 RepID=R7WQU1_9NOCA|nr:hypothetical protein [Rhodococcus rhodnii]EOM77682.1 hypothetical protein Rrhod_0923 [Rhodococcus rhodnii LMG 5362]TXG89356.1 hypothetical protein DW322_02740 [Rhodococcus rhodnii]
MTRHFSRTVLIAVPAALAVACAPVQGEPATTETVADAVRVLDPCALVPEDSLGDGEILQYGSAVQATVCAALVRRPDGTEVRVELSLLPSSFARSDGPDLARGLCERTFTVPGGHGSVRVAEVPGVDTCDAAQAVADGAAAILDAGEGRRGPTDPLATDPCSVLDAPVPGPPGPPRPFHCSDDAGTSVDLSLRTVSDRGHSDEPVVGPDGCTRVIPVGKEIDITREDVDVDEFARSLGRAHVVVTVRATNCGTLATVAERVERAFA